MRRQCGNVIVFAWEVQGVEQRWYLLRWQFAVRLRGGACVWQYLANVKWFVLDFNYCFCVEVLILVVSINVTRGSTKPSSKFDVIKNPSIAAHYTTWSSRRWSILRHLWIFGISTKIISSTYLSNTSYHVCSNVLDPLRINSRRRTNQYSIWRITSPTPFPLPTISSLTLNINVNFNVVIKICIIIVIDIDIIMISIINLQNMFNIIIIVVVGVNRYAILEPISISFEIFFSSTTTVDNGFGSHFRVVNGPLIIYSTYRLETSMGSNWSFIIHDIPYTWWTKSGINSLHSVKTSIVFNQQQTILIIHVCQHVPSTPQLHFLCILQLFLLSFRTRTSNSCTIQTVHLPHWRSLCPLHRDWLQT